MALAVPAKGSAKGTTAQRVMQLLRAWSHGPICLRADGERAIEVIKKEI